MPDTLKVIEERLQLRIQAQGNFQKQWALEEDLENALKEERSIKPGKPTKIVAVGRKQPRRPRFSPPKLGFREPTPQESIEVLGEKTSSEEEHEESLDEFEPSSKLERKAAKQLMDLRRSSQTSTQSTSYKDIEKKTRTITFTPFSEEEESSDESDPGREVFREREAQLYEANQSPTHYDPDEPIAAQANVDFSDDPMVKRAWPTKKDYPEYRPQYEKNEDDQEVWFYGTDDTGIDGKPVVSVLEEPIFGDHEYLDQKHARHTEVFWADCIYDECQFHLQDKELNDFFPRRRKQQPIPMIYLHHQLGTWIVKEFKASWLHMQPSPEHPVLCYNGLIKHWSKCMHDECMMHYVGKAKTWRTQIREQTPPR
ncbi:uncharacterized protein ColSpa_04666 [Colletotrichum spaethianum]|uniref:Uncharacterized protein n=1 Tax=Colletotrichum spaethianum TaxID=700344 RepID=A0AA37NWN3_9PEZI|nr:uncharacterized protein ColSpa_00017 [Colletotrichum spaethianum]XP_049126832.1 uncharacterized protein ColSpa_04663 [Colletotrichum spaethianum]XP_049126835.1 uncharacterized protein ColSpa_04666 [Colletotrichum spaethianum]GKT39836.1 hypothetical protein ColSpa_00017 [Colletotrichum spaethianum]GKT44482.1 hypothetical protein ColSpa_04663 [Colletotrichum spaethianum]GKT44485.1 hypothetical protein ColSpa_04666 [Colletotrichum spaethianum]